MKKTLSLISLSLCTLSSLAQADTVLGIYAGADAWRTETTGSFAKSEQTQQFAFEDASQHAFHLALEHFVPVLPNIRVQYSTLETTGSTTLTQSFDFGDAVFPPGSVVQSDLDLSNTDYTLYYELLDNALAEIDLGLTAKHIKGDVSVVTGQLSAFEEVNQWLPMLYLDTKVGVLGTGLDVFFSGNATRWQDSHLYDVQAGLGYELLDNLLLDMRLKVGYRVVDLQLDDIDNLYADLKFAGVFAGLTFHF